jgi:glycerol-3-phosphate O-acyltransferase
MLRSELVGRMQEVVDLLRLQDARLTPALAADEASSFEDSIVSMQSMDLIKVAEDARGEILFFDESKRRALDFYRNSILHFLALPSWLARRLLSGPAGPGFRVELADWLDFFYTEFFTPRGEILAAHIDAFIDLFERRGWLERADGELRATEKGRPGLRFLAEQTRGIVEAYYCACAAVAALPESDEPVGAKELAKAASEQFERAVLIGEVERREAANATTFSNAFDLLVRSGVLERTRSEGRRAGETGFKRGANFVELAALRERLAAALAAR